MKNINIVSFLIVSLFIVSCSQDIKEIEKENKISYRLDDSSNLDYLAFETMLNQTYTSKNFRPIIPKVFNFSFNHSGETILASEQNRLIQAVASIEYYGKDPFIIDVDINRGLVSVTYDMEFRSNENPDLPICPICPVAQDPTPVADPCQSYDERLEAALNCDPEVDHFNGLSGLMTGGGFWSGGLNSIETGLLEGFDCDGNPIAGGGFGAIGAAINANIPTPDNHRSFIETNEQGHIGIYGSNEDEIYSDGPDLITIASTSAWSGDNLECLDNAALNQMYCDLLTTALENVPEGFYLAHVEGIRLVNDSDDVNSPDWYLHIIFSYAKSESCCDCCC